MQNSPLSKQSLFWDADISKIDKEKNKEYIIARILESGNLEDVNWLRSNYSSQEIENTIVTTGRISRRTAYFWKVILGINQEIKCLSNQYRTIQKKHWS